MSHPADCWCCAKRSAVAVCRNHARSSVLGAHTNCSLLLLIAGRFGYTFAIVSASGAPPPWTFHACVTCTSRQVCSRSQPVMCKQIPVLCQSQQCTVSVQLIVARCLQNNGHDARTTPKLHATYPCGEYRSAVKVSTVTNLPPILHVLRLKEGSCPTVKHKASQHTVVQRAGPQQSVVADKQKTDCSPRAAKAEDPRYILV